MIVCVTVIVSVYGYSQREVAPKYETTLVTRGDVIQEVSVTGRVESDSVVHLAFERSGRIASEPIPVGVHVAKGAILARLDAREVEALRAQAQANLDVEIIRRNEIKRGARVEDIAVSEAAVKSATASLNDSEATYWDKSELAFNAIQDAIYVKTDVLFDNPRSNAPKLIAPVPDQKLITAMEQERIAIGNLFPEGAVIGEKTDLSDPNHKKVAISKELVNRVKNYLDNLAGGVSSILPSSQTSQVTIDGWKTNVGLARSGVSAAYSALLASDEKHSAAKQALALSESQLDLKKAPATEETLSAQEARIRGLQATLMNYDAQIAKSVIVAPFAGIVTRQNAKLGETIAPNVSVVSLMSDGIFKIIANVPEVDVAKVSVEDEAHVTLDAYGSDQSFTAVVSQIDPAETVLEGVSTYKVTLRFNQPDPRIRSGMTANIDISTEKSAGVLYVPLRAITTRDGNKFVRVPYGLGEKEVSVVLGLRGSDGHIEVLSGLSEGETVITFSVK